jgi:hypothetical protein
VTAFARASCSISQRAKCTLESFISEARLLLYNGLLHAYQQASTKCVPTCVASVRAYCINAPSDVASPWS